MDIEYFYENFYRFMKRFLPLLTQQVFFEIFLPQTPGDVLPIKSGNFLEGIKGIEYLQQNILEKLRFSDSHSEQV